MISPTIQPPLSEPYRELGQAEGIIRDFLRMVDQRRLANEFGPSDVVERARAFVAASDKG